MAMLGLFWFWVGAVYGLRFLYGRDQGSGSMDRRVQFANEIGLVCTLLATLSGMVFATVQWGTPWSWDPKQTSILVLIVIYVSYFGLRMSVENPDLRGRLSAVYAVIGAVMTPLLMYVVPHLPIFPGLHPTEVISQGLDTKWRLIYWSFTLGFLGVTIWLFQLKLRIASLSEWLEQRVAEPAVEFATRAVRNPARGVMANRAGGAPEGGVQ
jgi:heme exporter protein C